MDKPFRPEPHQSVHKAMITTGPAVPATPPTPSFHQPLLTPSHRWQAPRPFLLAAGVLRDNHRCSQKAVLIRLALLLKLQQRSKKNPTQLLLKPSAPHNTIRLWIFDEISKCVHLGRTFTVPLPRQIHSLNVIRSSTISMIVR